MSGRVLLFSSRNIRNEVFRGFDFEFEDFVASVDEVEWYLPEFRHPSNFKRRVAEGFSRRLFKWPINPAYKMPKIEGEYDLFFVQCMFIWDLQYIGRIPDWSKNVKQSIIYITELFLTYMARDPQYMEVLKRFDLILTSYSGTVEALEKYTGVKTRFYAPCIDALMGAPDPKVFHRPIEIFSMGRCQKLLFHEFKKLVKEHGWTYLYNPTHVTTIDDYRENRTFLQDTLRRTLFFEVNPAKFDEKDDSNNQHEMGFRYFEGIAAGAVLIGTENRNPNFKDLFPWDDAVIHLPENVEDIVEFLLELFKQKERLERASRAGVLGALTRHDFYYRWAFTLEHTDLKPLEPLQRRHDRLLAKAEDFK